jgi:replication fork protection complex subunit Tof1/Swi1
LIAALTWPIDVAQELKEMADGPAVVTDYASLLRAQQEYKACADLVRDLIHADYQAMVIQTDGPLRSLLALMLPCLAKTRKEEKDERVISLGLHIIRNLLSVKDAVASDTTTGQKEEMSRMQVRPAMSLRRARRLES